MGELFAKFCKSKVELWKMGKKESRRATEDREGVYLGRFIYLGRFGGVVFNAGL